MSPFFLLDYLALSLSLHPSISHPCHVLPIQSLSNTSLSASHHLSFLFHHHASIHLTVTNLHFLLVFFHSTMVSSSNPRAVPSPPAFSPLSTLSSIPHLHSLLLPPSISTPYQCTANTKASWLNSTQTLPAAQSVRLATGRGVLSWQHARQVLWGLSTHEATTTFWSSSQAITGLHFSLAPMIFCIELTNIYTATHIRHSLNLEEKLDFGRRPRQASCTKQLPDEDVLRNNWPGTMVLKKRAMKRSIRCRGGVAGAAKGFPLTDSLDMPFYLYNKQQSKAG